ncbi:MAG: translation elongation factor Ts [Nevskiales bacterium]
MAVPQTIVTAKLVQELRERTGAGMMECKRALEATGGEIEAAIEKMRKEGQAKADKKAGRVAAEGRIVGAVSADAKAGVLVEINCETDFVGKDESFVAFASEVGQLALNGKPASVDALNSLRLTSGETVDERRRALIAKLGENMNVRRLQRIEIAAGRIVSYLHGSRIGVLVAVEGGEESLAKDIAMHIAASNPGYVTTGQVPAEIRAKEREILISQAESSGKPREIIEKMVEGRLNKFLAENTLLGQPFVRDPEQTVEKLLKSKNAKVTSFVRFEVGEGIQKDQKDFAEEVKAQAAAASR